METIAEPPFSTVRRFLIYRDREGRELGRSGEHRAPRMPDTSEFVIAPPKGTASIHAVEGFVLDRLAPLPLFLAGAD